MTAAEVLDRLGPAQQAREGQHRLRLDPPRRLGQTARRRARRRRVVIASIVSPSPRLPGSRRPASLSRLTRGGREQGLAASTSAADIRRRTRIERPPLLAGEQLDVVLGVGIP